MSWADSKCRLAGRLDFEDFLWTQNHILPFEDLKMHVKMRLFEVLFPRQPLSIQDWTWALEFPPRHSPPPTLILFTAWSCRLRTRSSSLLRRLEADAEMVKKWCEIHKQTMPAGQQSILKTVQRKGTRWPMYGEARKDGKRSRSVICHNLPRAFYLSR